MPGSRWSDFRALDAYRKRQILTGDLIRPWIGAGPFFYDVSKEVSGRSFFEDLESHTGEELFRRYVAEDEALLEEPRVEGDTLTYLGKRLAYEVIDHEEPLVNWGQYFRGNNMVAQFLCTRVRAPAPVTARFRALARVDPQIAIAVNGKIQYRSYDTGFVRTDKSWDGEQSLEFHLTLNPGENVLTVGAFRMGRLATGALYIESLDTPLTVAPPLRPLTRGFDRAALETGRDLFHPAREWFCPGESVRLLRQGDTVDEAGEVICDVLVRDHPVVSKRVSTSDVEAVLGIAGDFDATNFAVRTTAIVRGEKAEPRTFDCICVRRTTLPPNVRTLDDRCHYALMHYAVGNEAWAQVARYGLGRPEEIDRDVIADGCRQIDRRLDCADFVLHPFLRLIHMDRCKDLIEEDIVWQITESSVGFRYWTDEPGSDCLVTGTENDQILFHTAEIIAGHLWPDEVFPSSGMTGREHIEHGTKLAAAWLENRARTGFREWHSSSYYPHWMSALQDYRPGERAAQVHPFQLTFRDKVAVFFSCPQTSNEGGGHRPDYWSGNGSLPRVFGERNVAVLLFRTGPVGWMSHAYFEQGRFDETVRRGGWLFARRANGYVAIWSEHGYEVGSRGQYAGRELICRARSNAWIVEAGRAADWVSFPAFVEAVAKTRPGREGDRMVYASPSVGTIEMGWEGRILLDGRPVDLDYPFLDGPYGTSEYGSGRMVIRYGDEEFAIAAR